MIIEDGVLLFVSKREIINGEFVIPAGVTKIGKQAFCDCHNLIRVKIPDGVIEIDRQAFYSCKKLTEVIVPDSVTRIGEQAFYSCKKLTDITIPDGVTEIGEKAFYLCESLTKITIPRTVTRIGDSAFCGCKKLTNVKISDGVTQIGTRMFFCCKSLTKVIIPKSVIRIGDSAFCGCKKLTNVKISDGVVQIGNSAFCSCDSLQTITIPKTVTQIEENAFHSFSSSIEANIMSRVTQIDRCAFRPEAILKFENRFECPFIIYSLIEDRQQIENLNFSRVKKILKDKRFDEPEIYYPDFYVLAYNLGLYFKNDVTIKIGNDQGKVEEQPVGNVAFNIFQKMFAKEDVDDKLKLSNLHIHFHGMNLTGVNEEFLRFLSNKTNLNDIIKQEKKQPGFITKVFEWFENRKNLQNLGNVEDETNTTKTPTSNANRYKIKRYDTAETGIDKIRWKAPTVDLIIKEFKEKKFTNVTPKTRHIAEYLGNFELYDQKHFEKAVEIDKERQEKNVPDHILGEELKQNLADAWEEYFNKTGKLREQILNEAGEVIENQADVADEIFTYEMLSKSDVANFAMGFFTTCCASLYGAGAGAMRAMITDKRMQPLVIRNSNDEIVAFGIVYVNKQEGYAVVNDFELNIGYKNDDKICKAIYDKAMEGVNAFVDKYNKKFKIPIKIVTCGISLNWKGINDFIKQNPQSKILKAPDFNDYKYAGSRSWKGDWHDNQYIIWQEKKGGEEK